MKNNILKFILIISLLLNISLLGTAAYTHYRQVSHPDAPFLARSSSAPAAFPPTMLFEQLSLSPEQVQSFRQKAALFHKGIDARRQEVEKLRTSLLSLMRADRPDNEKIEVTIGQINSKQNDMQKLVVAHMLEFKSMLDRDQQKKFLDMIEGAMIRRGETLCPQ